MPSARPCEGTVPVGDGPHALVPAHGRVQSHGGAVPVSGRGRGAGEFLAGERLGRQALGAPAGGRWSLGPERRA